MAFGGKDKLTKQDLIDAGFDPDLLKTLQEKGVNKDDLANMKKEILDSLTPTITDLLKSGFTELENKLKPGNKGGGGNGDGGNKDGNGETVDENTEFITDPTAFINKKISTLGAAAAVEIMKTKRQIAIDSAVNTLKGFKNETLRAEIMKELDEKYPADKLARFGSDPIVVVQQVHDMILGRHHDDIVTDTNKREGKFNLVHSGGGSSSGNGGNGGSGNGGGNTEKPVITEDERKIMKKYNMTEEEWIQQGKDMETEEVNRRKVGA